MKFRSICVLEAHLGGLSSYVSTIMVKTNGTKGLLGPVFNNEVRKYHKNTNYGDEKCDFFRKKIKRCKTFISTVKCVVFLQTHDGFIMTVDPVFSLMQDNINIARALHGN